MIFTRQQVAGLAAALSMCAAPAWATYCQNGAKDYPKCTPPTTPTTISGTSSASSNSNATADSQADAAATGYGGNAQATGGTSSATGGRSSASVGDVSSSISGITGGTASGGNSAINDSSRYGMYVFPAPVHATPLPTNLCPKGDSVSWSFGWNFVSYASSSTRTELECLEKVLAVIRAQPVPAEPRLPDLLPGERVHPVCTVLKPKKTAPAAKPKRVCN